MGLPQRSLKTSFHGTTTAVLRAHFRKWATTAPVQKQGVDTWGYYSGYMFCLMIDAEALESILNSDPDNIKTGFVHLNCGQGRMGAASG